MGLGYFPAARVESDSKVLEAIVNQRLMSWSRVDASGVQTDQINLVIDTQGQSGLPKEGAVLTWFEGYEGNLKEKGSFKITRITPTLYPPMLKIIATAAPFQVDDKTAFKERKTRTFEAVSFANLFRGVVSAHGFSPRVAADFESDQIGHVDQTDETDVSFLTRLARERGAVAKPVGELYVLAKKGQLKTVSGKDIPKVVLSVPAKNEAGKTDFINCQLDRASRSKVKGVKAVWLNVESGEEVFVEVGEAPFKKLRQSYESSASAKQACGDELLQVTRKGSSLRIELPGNPDLVAEGLLLLDDSFPAELAGEWKINKVSARGEGSGYRCVIDAEVI